MSKETKENLGAGQKFGVALTSGLVAGAAAAVLSHVRYSIELTEETTVC